MQLQENKATNLSIAAKRICCIIIAPGETFSFWELVGNPTANKGYKEGLTIAKGCTSSAIGGGMCQFTNLLHWLVLHSPLTIVEHHHHDGVDLFPDFNRQVPFGVGTSILYNYLDYRFKNNTDTAFQISASIQGEYLCGLLYAENPIPQRYHIKVEGEKFVLEDNIVYRTGNVYRKTVDVRTGNLISKELIRQNHARVTYDTSGLEIENSK